MSIDEAITTLLETSFFLPERAQPALTMAIRSLAEWKKAEKDLITLCKRPVESEWDMAQNAAWNEFGGMLLGYLRTINEKANE